MNDISPPDAAASRFGHAQTLDILAASEPGAAKAFAETLIDELGAIEVLASRTGIVMLPYVDTVQNTAFHLGEVLVSEAHIRLTGRNIEGYGAVVGRDLEHSMAMAIVDACITAGIGIKAIEAFLASEHHRQRKIDETRLRKVESTRVRMETF
ncbi:phosphonate C-P lyase system protein PhnG [Rhizobium terrae]|uniref:phosphonate C-P lyase system protein PhnG n=1 Tax=Rhizobium terrae TaxID=2171756 RepID=UPI000E3E129D|nr:phosphonate C-P lyase system protein PhnG [Rhizobium terrae]